MEQPPDENTPANLVHAEYLTDPGRLRRRVAAHVADRRSAERPHAAADGCRTERARTQARASARPARPGGRADSYTDRTLLERCITRGVPGAILPGLYNNNIRITQSPGFVAIVHEMVHETRIVPLDGSAFSNLRGYMGESRGHWEGDTLVVETRNFNGKAPLPRRGREPALTRALHARRARHDRLQAHVRGRHAVDAAVDGRVFACAPAKASSTSTRATKATTDCATSSRTRATKRRPAAAPREE